MTTFTATYSPDDNKIRLSASSRLDKDLYARVRDAGFIWAPKQEIFVAPMWTPAREDLAIELAGEIDDEDTSLVDRAEDRAERFEGYSENRKADAESAHRAVSAIADNIPLGQPILVGHHSERHARRDAERIENGMRKAIKMWDTAQYWKSRAAGALRHAKYKELPAVRARRMKKIEADLRKSERERDTARRLVTAWTAGPVTMKRAMVITGSGLFGIYRSFPLAEYPRQPPASQYEGDLSLWSALKEGIITPEQARDIAMPLHERGIAHHERWIAHYTNRLAYERAMMLDAGGLPGAQHDYQVGGQVCRGRGWFFIRKVNRINGVVNSVSVLGHHSATITLDEITDYRAPAEGVAEKVKAASAKGPMCNYPGPGFCHMTAAEWKELPRWSDQKYTENHKATATHGAHRTKHRPMKGFTWACVFITDAKRIDPPALAAPPITRADLPTSPPPAPVADRTAARQAAAAEAAPFEALRAAARDGVKVVVASQLFPTPAPLAARMVKAAEVQQGDRILEPSAGTGAILRALAAERNEGGPLPSEVVAVERDATLAAALAMPDLCTEVRAADFLAAQDLGMFDRILMNPPFVHGADIVHIKRALRLLAPGGRLVAICADGPRQTKELRPLVDDLGGTWEQLPADTFAAQGTNVRTVMLVVDA